MVGPEPIPDRLAALFEADRAVHVYGLADLEEPYWSSSRWWLRGHAAVGCLDLPGSADAIVYAVCAGDPMPTLRLLVDLCPVLPNRFTITGPVGLTKALSGRFEPTWHGPHFKMALHDPGQLSVPTRPLPIGPRHLAQLGALIASDPHDGQFFTPHLLEAGTYRGIWEGDQLVAVAGTHVVSQAYGVAAVGNVVTHPDHRRRGYARETTSAVVSHLLERVSTIGLNVDAEHPGTRRLYESIGFRVVSGYEEAAMVRSSCA